MPSNNLIPIVVTIDENYAQHLGVMLTSLFVHNRDLKFNIFVFCEVISEGSQNKLIQVGDYYEQKICFQTISTESIQDFKIHAHASLANYFRLLAFSQLPAEISRVLYLDVDLLILKSISKLWEINLESKLLAAVPEQVVAHNNERLHIPNQYPYFNSGVMVVNIDLWNAENMSKITLDYIEKNPEKIHYWDQDALNATCYNKCLILEDKWNTMSANFAKNEDNNKTFQEATILHYTGMSKPWQFINEHPHKLAYYRYLKKTPWKNFKPADKTFGNFLRKFKFGSKVMCMVDKYNF